MPTFPVPIEMADAMKGIFVGGCVERGEGSSFRARAHAHTYITDPNRGWVCVRSAKRLTTPSGLPSRLLWHEYAHLTVPPGSGHNALWRKRITELGFPAEGKRYIRPRPTDEQWATALAKSTR